MHHQEFTHQTFPAPCELHGKSKECACGMGKVFICVDLNGVCHRQSHRSPRVKFMHAPRSWRNCILQAFIWLAWILHWGFILKRGLSWKKYTFWFVTSEKRKFLEAHCSCPSSGWPLVHSWEDISSPTKAWSHEPTVNKEVSRKLQQEQPVVFFFLTFEYSWATNGGKLQGNILEVPQSFSKMWHLSSKALGQKWEVFKQVNSY